MSSSLLPHALLDLTLARASMRLEGAAHHGLRRGSLGFPRRFAHHSLPLDTLTSSEYVPYENESDRSLYSRYVVACLSTLRQSSYCNQTSRSTSTGERIIFRWSVPIPAGPTADGAGETHRGFEESTCRGGMFVTLCS